MPTFTIDSDNNITAHATKALLRPREIRSAVDLLRLIPGVRVEEVDEGCCGISGTYGVKVEKYDLSMKIGSRLFEAVKAAGSDSVLADCETCRMQVEHGAGSRSAHPIDILARAYGYR